MDLIKRSNIPPDYKEYKKYDYVAHRMKSAESSFYLINRAASINCYLKYDELLERSQNEYLTVPEEMLEASKPIIRFEVQCKRRKLYDTIEQLGVKDNGEINKCGHLLQPWVCEEVIRRYFFETVGKGDWCSFAQAVGIIDSQKFYKQRKKRLVDVLHTASRCRSVHKAIESCQKSEVDSFKHTLNELSSFGINPVTIPQECKIKCIPNLLDRYYKQLVFEQSCVILDQLKKDDLKTFKKVMKKWLQSEYSS